jgi:hypothetical protein
MRVAALDIGELPHPLTIPAIATYHRRTALQPGSLGEYVLRRIVEQPGHAATHGELIRAGTAAQGPRAYLLGVALDDLQCQRGITMARRTPQSLGKFTLHAPSQISNTSSSPNRFHKG